jgi:putative membrane protein
MINSRKTVLLATVFALMAGPALAQTSTNAHGTTGAAPASETQASAQAFVNLAANSNMFEIQAAKLAEQKDHQKPDQRFAKRMIKDHSKASDQLKELIDSGKVKAELPTALDGDHQQKLTQLQNLSGKQFDQAYDKMQKVGHIDAVKAFKNYAQNGDNPALKRWAKKTLPTLRTHLSMAEKLD